MSGDVTYQALERLTHMPSRSGNQGDRIASQLYYDVFFTGGSIANVTLTNVTIDGSTISSPGVFNVRNYGALGNGIVDDYAACQAAITAAQSAGGGQVYFPKGTYLVSQPLSVTSDNVSLIGTGIGNSIVLASSLTLGTLLIGNQSASQSGKTTANILQSMTFQCPSNHSGTNVTAFGCTRLKIDSCDIFRGNKAIELRNADQTLWMQSSFRVTRASATAVSLLQGSSDDVTTMVWFGGLVDVTGVGGNGLVFGDASGGAPNEFNDIFMCGIKFDGNNTASTIGMKLVAGARNLRMQNVEMKEWGATSFDGVSAILDGQNVYVTVDNSKILGKSTSAPTNHFYLKETTGGITYVCFRNTQLSNATTAIRVSNGGTKSPKIFVDGTESFNLTNFFEADDSTVTPNIAVGQIRLGGSVTNKVGTNLASATVSWEDHGTRAGNFLLYAQGTITVADGTSFTDVTFTALQYTPSAKDISVIKTDSAIGGQFYVSNITSSGFRLNVQTAPSGTTFTYQFKVRAS